MSRTPKTKGAVLVTGGAKRIGKAICLALSAYGYAIALHYNHSRSDAQKQAEQIREEGGVCELFQHDLMDERQVQSLIPAVSKKFPQLNLLINNASLFKKSNLKSESAAALDRHLAIHLKAPYLLTREFAKRCQQGQVINILDTNIVRNKSAYGAYLISKKSLRDLTQLAAVELAPHIRVNGIAPGLILPPVREKNDYLDRLARRIPLKKRGKVSHITQAIQFLLENDYVTGQILFVDGGEHLI